MTAVTHPLGEGLVIAIMQRHSLDSDWRFYLGDPPGAFWQALDDSSWQGIDLPHDWSIGLERGPDQPCGNSGGYFPMGRGWYRKHLETPEEWRGRQVYIEFEGVYMNAEVWLNETYLRRHPYGYTSFLVDLTPHLRYGATNVLTVTVDNSHQINSRWYSGSGIYRHAWLLVADPTHIAHWGVGVTTPTVTADVAVVRAETTLSNHEPVTRKVTLRSRVVTMDGDPVAQTESEATLAAGTTQVVQHKMQVQAPRLWSPDAPHLYRLESEVIAGGARVDAVQTIFGIRSVALDPQRGFLLNDAPLKLKGGCVHHDNGVLGAASYDRAEERKVEIHKASGYNAIRCAHNPPAPAFLDACDRLGMLVIDEAFDCWRMGKNAGDYHVAFDEWQQRDIESMVLRDRNHPSVVMWSIGNEVGERDGRSDGARLARMLADEVRRLDSTRPVTSAICDTFDGQRQWTDTNAVFAALDVGGYNYLWERYEEDRARNPDRLIAGTESFPIQALDNWAAVEANPYVIGDFVWTSLDYLGEAGIGRVDNTADGKPVGGLGAYPWHQANCGDLDLCGFKRPQSYYRDVIWGVGTQLYIVVQTPAPQGKVAAITQWGWPDVWPNWNWPDRAGQTLRVEVYSACQQVELLLNGRSLGSRPTGRAERYTAVFEVLYEPGELRAVGTTAGHPCAETVLRTAADPSCIRLNPDRATLGAANDLCYVTVEVVDGAGIVHPLANNLIAFHVEGPGTLLAVGNGDPTSTESYVGDRRSVYRGRGLAVVKATGEPGVIRLSARSRGLVDAQVTIGAAPIGGE
jgi:beta-galactosidase